jgi:uncharacterized protein (TIGR03086 family)
MPQPDLHPAADQMARLIAAVPDDSLDAPTPCPQMRLGDLLDHIGAFTTVFVASAAKDLGALTERPPVPEAANLEAGWRGRMAGDLAALADAWAAPDAWDGMTQAGGQDLPGAVAGRIALDELVVHGWDIATSSGQPFTCDDATLEEIADTVRQFRSGNDGEIPGLFGPVVPVPDGAPLLDQVLGLTGRDPSWSPSG